MKNKENALRLLEAMLSGLKITHGRFVWLEIGVDQEDIDTLKELLELVKNENID